MSAGEIIALIKKLPSEERAEMAFVRGQIAPKVVETDGELWCTLAA